jgi:hypothetical protein
LLAIFILARIVKSIYVLTAVGVAACALLNAERAADALRSAVVKSNWTASGKALLQNGEYRERAAPGSASDIVVKLGPLISEARVDNRDMAAAVIITDAGGSGTFNDLALFVRRGGEWQNADLVALGDRVKVEALRLTGGQVSVELIIHGPRDPLCCPTQPVTRRFALKDERLVAVSDNRGSGPQ